MKNAIEFHADKLLVVFFQEELCLYEETFIAFMFLVVAGGLFATGGGQQESVACPLGSIKR